MVHTIAHGRNFTVAASFTAHGRRHVTVCRLIKAPSAPSAPSGYCTNGTNGTNGVDGFRVDNAHCTTDAAWDVAQGKLGVARPTCQRLHSCAGVHIHGRDNMATPPQLHIL